MCDGCYEQGQQIATRLAQHEHTWHPDHAGHRIYLRADNNQPHYCGTCHQPSSESNADGRARFERIKALVVDRLAREKPQEPLW